MRRGFTIIELLVVITIASVLLSLTAIGAMEYVGRAKENATQTTLLRIDEEVAARVAALDRYHSRPISEIQRDWLERGWKHLWRAYFLDGSAGVQSTDPGTADEARKILSWKQNMKECFPLTPDELKRSYWFWAQFDTKTIYRTDANGKKVAYPEDNTTLYVNRIYIPHLDADEYEDMEEFLADIDENEDNNEPGTSPGKPSILDRPGEIFVYALKNAPVFGGLPMTGDEFEERMLIDPDGDGNPELCDAWDQPLRFYRWPTRLVKDATSRHVLMPNIGEDTFAIDPDDRVGYLSMPNQLFNSQPGAVFYHDAKSFHSPLLMSAGPDGVLGIAEPDESLPLGTVPRYGLARPLGDDEAIYDNLTNHQ